MGGDQDQEPDLVEILPFLFLGNERASGNKQRLQSLGISTVINVTTKLPNRHPGAFQYHRVAVEDKTDSDLSGQFDEIIELINAGPHNVLVHCAHGTSRLGL